MPSNPGGGSSASGNRGREGWAAEDRFAYRDRFKDRIDEWMDEAGVDAVVYPGFLSDTYNNDSASNQNSSDRGTGIPVSAAGIPTVTVPVGVSPNGFSIAMQIVERAFDDAAVLGYGYALEQQTQARLFSECAPPLQVVSDGPGGPPDGVPGGPPEGVPGGPPSGVPGGPTQGAGPPEGSGPPDNAGPHRDVVVQPTPDDRELRPTHARRPRRGGTTPSPSPLDGERTQPGGWITGGRQRCGRLVR